MIETNVKDLLAERLKILREEKGFSQVKLADELGVSRGSINYYENSERAAGIDFIYKAANYFDCSADYLLGLSEFRDKEEKKYADLLTDEINARLDKLDGEYRSKIYEMILCVTNSYTDMKEYKNLQHVFITNLDILIHSLCELSKYPTAFDLINKNKNRQQVDILSAFMYTQLSSIRSDSLLAVNSLFDMIENEIHKVIPRNMQKIDDILHQLDLEIDDSI